VVAAALAAAVVTGGVPVALLAVRGGSAAPTAAAPTAATPSLAWPAAATRSVRGSLAGDTALLDQAIRLLLADSSVDRSTVRVAYAEQSEGYRAVLLYGTRKDGTVVSLIAAGAPGRPLTSVTGTTGKPQSIDAGLGQQYYAPQHLLTRFTIGDRSFGMAVFPDGYRATIRHNPSIAADCTLATEPATALPVPSFFPIARGDAPNVAVTTPQGTPATAKALEPTGNGSAVPTLPPAGEIAAQIRDSIRGKKAAADELSQYADPIAYGSGVGTLPDRFTGVWAGDLPPDTGKGYVALFGGVYRSGAMILQGFVTDQSGNGFSGWLTGCLPAGALAHTVISARLRTRDTGIPGSPIVIIAPPSAVTAEVSFGAGAPVPVPLTEGGGFLRHDGTAGQVRALDAAGHVVAIGTVDRHPVVGVPLQPR
jgi:hypothetical protein